MILFWISGFLLPFHGGMVAGLIFSTEHTGHDYELLGAPSTLVSEITFEKC